MFASRMNEPLLHHLCGSFHHISFARSFVITQQQQQQQQQLSDGVCVYVLRASQPANERCRACEQENT